MDKLEVIVKTGNLTVALSPERGCDRTIILNPAERTPTPQMQFSAGSSILRAVNYDKTDDISWTPINNPGYRTYDVTSPEYRAFEKITEEARAIQQRFQQQ